MKDAFHYLGEILPTPQHVVYGKGTVSFRPGETRGGACIVLGDRAPLAHRTAARELQERFDTLTDGSSGVPVVKSGGPSWQHFGTAILVGTRPANHSLDALCRRKRVPLSSTKPGKEGYTIRCFQQGTQKVIVCGGCDDAGVTYAAQSLQQLARAQGKTVHIRKVRVDDYPALPYRGMFVADVAAARRLASWKFNSFDIVYTKHSDRWRHPDREYCREVTTLCREARVCGCNATPYINPLHINLATWTAYRMKRKFTPGFAWQRINIASDKDIRALYATFRMALEAGSRTIALALDDFAVSTKYAYVPTFPEEWRKFDGDVGKAHVYLCRRIYEFMKRDYPDAVLIVCPAYYYNFTTGGHGAWTPYADHYLRQLGELPSDILIQWTGPDMRSPRIVKQDVDLCIERIGREPCLWDNASYALHQPPRYLFDPFAAGYFDGLPCHLSGVHANGKTTGAIYQVSIIQIASYLWNPAAYDSEKVLRKALHIAAGPKLVDPLLNLRDHFIKLTEACPFLDPDPRAQKKMPQQARTMDRAGYQWMKGVLYDLRTAMRAVDRECGNRALVGSLRKELVDPLMARAEAFDARRHVKARLQKSSPDGIHGTYVPPESFVGGGWTYHPQPCRVLRGQRTPVHGMQAHVKLSRSPVDDVLMHIRCRDSLGWDKATQTPIRIRINGHTLHHGPSACNTPATVDLFYEKTYLVKKAWLTKGDNVISIENLDKESPALAPNIKIDWIKLFGCT